MEHYLVLSNLDSKEFYANGNSASKFRTKLYKPLLLNGQWEVGLITFDVKSDDELPHHTLILVQSSLCENLTVVGGSHRLPVLKTLIHNSGVMSWECNPPTYLPLAPHFLESVEVYITTRDGVTPAFKSATSSCVLHLRQIK